MEGNAGETRHQPRGRRRALGRRGTDTGEGGDTKRRQNRPDRVVMLGEAKLIYPRGSDTRGTRNRSGEGLLGNRSGVVGAEGMQNQPELKGLLGDA